jgi:hypothetical protein
MMATGAVRHAGVWKTPNNIYVKAAGTWKVPAGAYVKSGGTWQQFWPAYPFVNSEAATLVANMITPPSDTRKGHIDTFIGALKSAGVWAKLDVLYVMAAHDSQAANLNWKTPATFPLVLTNSPTFTVDQGYKGNGTSTQISSAYNATTFPSPQYTQDDACVGVYMRVASTLNGTHDFLMGGSRLLRQSSGLNYQGRINDAASMNGGTPTVGHWAVKRTGASARSIWKNGVSVASDTVASAAVGSATISILSAAASSWSDGQVSCAYIGAGIDIPAMHTALTTYLQAVDSIGELPATYTVSSTYGGYSGHTGTGAGLRDAIDTGTTSVWGNNSETDPFIKADLGSAKTVDHIDVMPIPASFDGWGVSYLNGTSVRGSLDDATYTLIAIISGAVEGAYKTIPVGATYRYIKIGKVSGDLAVGEFRIYGSS